MPLSRPFHGAFTPSRYTSGVHTLCTSFCTWGQGNAGPLSKMRRDDPHWRRRDCSRSRDPKKSGSPRGGGSRVGHDMPGGAPGIFDAGERGESSSRSSAGRGIELKRTRCGCSRNGKRRPDYSRRLAKSLILSARTTTPAMFSETTVRSECHSLAARCWPAVLCLRAPRSRLLPPAAC